MKNNKETSPKSNVAIIGSGISGLSCAYFLDQDMNVTIYERESRAGGHANSLPVEINGETFNVDRAFYLFSNQCRYLSAFFDHLGIERKINDFKVIYSNYFQKNTFFIPPVSHKNILNFFNMDWQYQMSCLYQCISNAPKKIDPKITAEEYFKNIKYVDQEFLNQFFYPLMSAIWTWPLNLVAKSSVSEIFRVCKYFAVIEIFNRKFFNVKNGASTYIENIISKLENSRILYNTRIEGIEKKDGKWAIKTKDQEAFFDHVVIATNAIDARKLLGGKNQYYDEILSLFSYNTSKVITHTDRKLMPRKQKDWSDYNDVYVPFLPNLIGTIWHGKYKKINLFTTYRAEEFMVDKEKVIESKEFMHPILDEKCMIARDRVNSQFGKDNLWLAGTYITGAAVHEDGLRSSINIVEHLSPNSARLNQVKSLVNNKKNTKQNKIIYSALMYLTKFALHFSSLIGKRGKYNKTI